MDYLVLCDSSVVLQRHDGCEVVTDYRTDRLPAYDRVTVEQLRNVPGGSWVASTEPRAAQHCLTGTVEQSALLAVLACTDGVSRLVSLFGWTWPEVLSLATKSG